MVSLHKHAGSRRQSKGLEVFKPRQEGMRRGRRRVDGTDPGGRRSGRVLSTLSSCPRPSAPGGPLTGCCFALPPNLFFMVRYPSPRPTILSVCLLVHSVKLFLESALCRGRGRCRPFIFIHLLCVSAPCFIAAIALNE